MGIKADIDKMTNQERIALASLWFDTWKTAVNTEKYADSKDAISVADNLVDEFVGRFSPNKSLRIVGNGR